MIATCLMTAWVQILPAQSKEDNGSLKTAEIPAHFEIQKDLVYKTAGDHKLTFDFIQSKNSQNSSAPLLIHIHGGGWRGGNKEAFYRHLFFDSVRPLMEKGLKVATINYRLAKEGGPSTVDSVTDCKDAVRYLSAKAQQYGIDPTRIALMGGSAGGHLTLMTALAPDAEYPTELPDCKEQLPPLIAAVPFYPLCHFGDPLVLGDTIYGTQRSFAPMLGGPVEENQELVRRLSPVYLVDKNSPPMFVLHGDNDPVLPVLSARLFVEKARKVGADIKYLEVKNGNHGFRTADDPDLDGIMQQVTTYLSDRLMKK